LINAEIAGEEVAAAGFAICRSNYLFTCVVVLVFLLTLELSEREISLTPRVKENNSFAASFYIKLLEYRRRGYR
jgi:hypothetical protein